MGSVKPFVLLGQPTPLPAQVATFLLQGKTECPPDLGDTLVIVPTAGAARAIRRELARQAGGLLLPGFRLPMQAMLDEEEAIATPIEKFAAWIRVLRATPRQKFASMVPSAVKLSEPEDWIGVAARLVSVCDALAESGLHSGSKELAEFCPHDSQRWGEFASLHEAYADLLHRNRRPDPDAVRLQRVQDAVVPGDIRRIVVAMVPDLPVIVSRWLGQLRGKGIAVEVLCWSCGQEDALFDDWGRPDPEWWTTRAVPVPDEVIVAENDTQSEASALVDFAARHGKNGFALVSADADSTSAFESELARRGTNAYLPEGKPLSRSEAATIVAGWEKFSHGHSLRALRPLLQLPTFLGFFQRQTEMPPQQVAAACDRFLSVKLCETLDAAREWSDNNQTGRSEDEMLRTFVKALEKFSRQDLPDRGLLGELYSGEGETDEQTGAELEALVETLEETESSPLLAELPSALRDALRVQNIARCRVFLPPSGDAVEISGWLEAPWTDAPVLCVAGCREGALPSGAGEDAFLPDTLRAKLGLPSNTSRYARDAYLMACLLRGFGPSRLRLGYSRFRSGGEPNRPSRLLFGCPDAELPSRVEKIFQPSPLKQDAVTTTSPWKLHLAKPSRVASIRVTGFKHYLECPLRFYLSQVKGLQAFDPEAREIGAADYGTLLHRVVENLHKSGPADSMDENVIAAFLDQNLEQTAARFFGKNPAAVVKVQVESMRRRLRHLATLQAEQRLGGWRMIESEYAVKKEHGFTVGPLALTGTMDRVESHEELGLRILDYKTFTRAKSPEETHFGPPRGEDEFAEACVMRPNKNGKPVERSWTDLQLPLYRHLAAEIWPEPARHGIAVGYVLLPGDPDDTQISLLELDQAAIKSALTCATAVAGRVAKGIFWPPSNDVPFDDYTAWFGGEDPREVFDQETMAILEGRE